MSFFKNKVGIEEFFGTDKGTDYPISIKGNEMLDYFIDLFSNLKISFDKKLLKVVFTSVGDVEEIRRDTFTDDNPIFRGAELVKLFYDSNELSIKLLEDRFGLKFGKIYRGSNESFWVERYFSADRILSKEGIDFQGLKIYRKDIETLENSPIAYYTWIS